EAGAGTRSRQASVEEGTDAVARQIREAAGKHALVSPQLDAALGYAKRQMAAARSELEEADPNASEAASLAEDALDALNATGRAPRPADHRAPAAAVPPIARRGPHALERRARRDQGARQPLRDRGQRSHPRHPETRGDGPGPAAPLPHVGGAPGSHSRAASPG